MKITSDVYNEHKRLLKKEVKVHLNQFELEIILMFVFFGWNLSLAIIPNQILRQTCLMKGFQVSECLLQDGESATKEIEDQIQPYVAKILMTKTLLTTFVPSVISLFLGPWTDKFGRKKVIIATLLGLVFSLALFVVISMVADYKIWINPWIYVLAFVPTIITGSSRSLSLATMCYVSDISDDANRSFHLTLIEISSFVGLLTGTISSSYIVKITSATKVFQISIVCVALASVYTISFVNEKFNLKDVSICSQMRELFSMKPIEDMMVTCLECRPLNEKRIIWYLIGISMLFVFAVQGNATIFYLFARERFQYAMKEVTLYESSSSVISIVGALIGLLILKKMLNFSDVGLAALASGSFLFDSLIKSSAQSGLQMYFASGIGLFKISSHPMGRSIIATVIPSSEIGNLQYGEFVRSLCQHH